MANLNPIKKAKYIADNFKKYIGSTYAIENEKYREQFIKELNNTEILKGPYISKNLEFKTTISLNDMINEGVVHPNFRKLGDMNLNRKLRSHQEKAIRKIAGGSNLIVTTGTGSGKTESYLYPVINEILKEKEISKPGIRAIFLFPMNALVNDQFDRVRRILNVYPAIRYAFFTGNTKSKESDSIREYIEATTGHKTNVNELLDREQIRKTPPHLLFTNYSMLEYILLRPTDDILLRKENTNNWKFIVLDEAHTYKGALGIEVGMLLRRLQNRIDHKIQYILTSATLGTEDAVGKKEIVDFAYRLTSGIFTENDILFSDRIKLNPNNAKYKIEPSDYLIIHQDYTLENVDALLSKYDFASNEIAIEGRLYDLLYFDENLYYLNDFTSSSQIFSELKNKLYSIGFENVEQISAFIDLICKCKKDGLKIMDLKYHSFVRSLDGAYVTLGENSQLTLEHKEFIRDQRTFEIGSCQKCNSVYIIGIIKNDFLLKNHSVDIFENYDLSEEINLDYFLLEEDIKDLDVNYNLLEKYVLCPKCGKIIPYNMTNKEKKYCEHNDIKKVIVYKVDKGDSIVKNNLTNCPICNGKQNYGLISTVSMGKESATALLTQIFFEAIDSNEEKDISIVPKMGLFVEPKKVEKPLKDNYKQILSFSDSRQQASFAVKFAETNHHRLLRKRLIYEMLNKNHNSKLTFETAETLLDSMISSKDLFDTEGSISSTKQAKITLLNEILKVDGIYGGEGLGLYYFEFEKINGLLADLTNDDVNRFLGELINKKIDINVFKCILNVFIEFLRYIPAIYYDGLTYDDRQNFFSYRMFDNHVTFRKPDVVKDLKNKDISNSVKSLTSKTMRMNRLEKYISKIIDNDDKTIVDKIIEKIWYVFINNEIVSESDIKNKLFRINASDFTLHSANDTRWYYCEKCRQITRINSYNLCPNCYTKSLIECNPSEIFKDNYYRYQYVNKKIEKLVYKEHTAQLSAEKGKERQLQFTNKNINYLSCSTTFEMGIDIGSLENVLLRNVPPSPANYVQRAGRAGRGKDSSAFVLTYCSPSSHDYTFFLEPLKMVEGKCSTPIFRMENKKIIFRHLLATSLSIFFKNNINYFDSVKAFFLDGGYLSFKDFLQSKPIELIDSTNKILETTDAISMKNGNWIDMIFKSEEFDIDFSLQKLKGMLAEFEEKKQQAIENNNSEAISYYARQIKNIENSKNIIGYLADSNLIPKYGFPTDLVEMKIKSMEINDDEYDLTRDMQIALSEYAPDSEIMVDKTIVTSRYINKQNELIKYFYYSCPKCHKTIIKYSDDFTFGCPYCSSADVKETDVSMFYTPRYGFTGVTKKKTSNILKPKRSYSSPIKYIGNGSLEGEGVFIGKIEFHTVKNDELLIVNDNPFYLCKKCGYAVLDRENALLPIKIKKHDPLIGKNCDGKLEKISLGYSYKTDVLKMVIDYPISGYNQVISTLFALLEGISIAFDIERNDIDGIFINENNRNVFVLFDTVPGGAGHVKRLLNETEMINALKAAYEKVSQECCDTACYNCLKNYKNQRYHEYLRREEAKLLLKQLIDDISKK